MANLLSWEVRLSVIHDVIMVGAGASGIGCGVVRQDLGITSFLIFDREHTGASFDRWPEEMHFITPSFTSNAFGLLDLNAVTLNTSPAFTLHVGYPTSHQYANYLRALQKPHRRAQQGTQATRCSAR
jgi:putative flavoprotein involved in K+ transport